MENTAQPRRPLSELLRAIETCPSIDKLFELVKNEHIVVRMKSQSKASGMPVQPLPQNPGVTPLDQLRELIKEAAVKMYEEPKPLPAPEPPKPTEQKPQEQKQIDRLLHAIDTCPSIDKLFEFVKSEHIVIQMKSQQAASNIPYRPLPQTKESPLERLREQVKDAVLQMNGKPSAPHPPQEQPPSNQKLLDAIDTCPTIDKLFEIVKNEHIVIQMKSQQAASNIPFRPLPQTKESPLEHLREQVREAAIAMDRNRSKADLIRRVETCPTIDKLFEIVKNEHIVIRMKSQSSASNLPQQRLSGDELQPDTTPLERLRQQVLQAIIFG